MYESAKEKRKRGLAKGRAKSASQRHTINRYWSEIVALRKMLEVASKRIAELEAELDARKGLNECFAKFNPDAPD